MSQTDNPFAGFNGAQPFTEFGWRVKADEHSKAVILELYPLYDVEAVTQLGLEPDAAKELSQALAGAAD